jgi:O-antigen ligase
LLILLGIVFTRSRAGIALAMFGLFLAMFAFARRLGGDNIYGSMGSIVAILLVLAAEVGLLPVLDRFANDPTQDLRWTIFATALDGIGHFFPFGSGAGTFILVYPRFQPIELGHVIVNHVHNDYLEALFEQGLLAVVLILLGVTLYVRQWKTVWTGNTWGLFRFIQVGAGIGILMMLLHSLIDFNLHIPVNAIFLAFFCWGFFQGI